VSYGKGDFERWMRGLILGSSREVAKEMCVCMCVGVDFDLRWEGCVSDRD